MTSHPTPSSADALADHLRVANRIVVFTGAGVSTESGIPDFRSPGGLWSQIKPITYQEWDVNPKVPNQGRDEERIVDVQDLERRARVPRHRGCEAEGNARVLREVDRAEHR